jgi:hypothetical protein
MDGKHHHRGRARAGVAVLVSAFAMTVSVPALAYRPFDGTDADVAPAGEFELEIGPAYEMSATRDPRIALPALVLNQGLVRGWELVLDARNVLGPLPLAGGPAMHVEDIDVQLKWLLRSGSLQGGSGVSVATEFGPLLPSLWDPAGSTGVGADANLIVSRRWPGLAAHVNGGVALTRNATTSFVGSVILEGSDGPRLRPVAEPLVLHDTDGSTIYSLLIGAIWRAGDDLVFDIGTRGGLLDGAVFAEVRAGLTWTFPVWTSAPQAQEVGAGRR